ncbi:tRNA (adenosine(37)-N6)-threonylcarbamoyltransferase complex ATPase subunit type 1 TsaE [Candidatus Pelagibacter sp.]|nr:tRNA (adenosine(37)-N6)-threonylcarbamoyltransferase complex ATPase subunit type 1 TsaE [Candidatus Pelagibacter sp.]
MHIATNSEIIDISLEVKTAELAKNFSQILKKGDVIFFHGEIGVGKTTFIRYLINNFQKNNHLDLTEVTSPTFNLVNEYDVGSVIIHHYDLYRLNSSLEIANIGLFENYKEILTLIEWPEKIERKIESKIDLFFEYGKDFDKRILSIKGLNDERLDVIR